MPVPAFRHNESITDVNISESVVLQKLLLLKVNKSAGPDGLHSYIPKSCAHTLCALSYSVSLWLKEFSLMSGNRLTLSLF